MEGGVTTPGWRSFCFPAGRRTVFFIALLGLTIFGSASSYWILVANGLTFLEVILLILFTLAFFVICLGFVNALFGFLLKTFSRRPELAAAPFLWKPVKTTGATTKTALVFPVYREDLEAIGETIRKLSAQLAREKDRFTVFILSDTPEAERGAWEEGVVENLRRHCPLDIIYRRRLENSGKKAGNIWDFCARWSAEYHYMVVFDADSEMGAEIIRQLRDLLDAHPQVGLIQTLPLIAHPETLFARILQFGHRLCGELLTLGASYWQLDCGNYYGHNAIVRLTAFYSSCKLPRLPGTPPFGGDILSHDFVEAAYLRRAGWEVWAYPKRVKSFERVPPNILEYAKRDRRWCQGNLQHIRVIGEPGLHLLSRFHLLTGILAYTSSAFWCLALLLSVIKFSIEAFAVPNYFPSPYSLFPRWPEFRTEEALSLFSFTLLLLFAPKFLGLIATLRERNWRTEFGSLRSLFGLLFLETIFSVLMAPTMMIFHTTFVVLTLFRSATSWGAQVRAAEDLSWREAVRSLRLQLFVGLGLLAVIAFLIPDQWIWFAPVVVGLLVAIPLARRSSRGHAKK